MIDNTDRRQFLVKAGFIAAGGIITAAQASLAASEPEEDVSPIEDLMREHGLLNRVLLVYDHCSEKLQNKEKVDLKELAAAREIIKNFVEAYHEKLEEEHLFPRLEKAKKLSDLTAVLRAQHAAGRTVTAELATALQRQDHSALVSHLRAFTRMYRPHEAREDTIVFPAFRRVVPDKQYKEMGEMFEAREHQLFGKEGFEGQVKRVEQIERELGIYDLSQFTPKRS